MYYRLVFFSLCFFFFSFSSSHSARNQQSAITLPANSLTKNAFKLHWHHTRNEVLSFPETKCMGVGHKGMT